MGERFFISLACYNRFVEKRTGFIIINKPPGPTSFNIISKLRRITGIKKIGHAGTLDPFASGVLICAIGREATKKIKEFVGMDKEYITEVFLGAETDTYDRTGLIKNYELKIKNYELKNVEKVLDRFKGKIQQEVPMYSATKIGGKKLYELARKGIEIERGKIDIEISNIEILDYKFPRLKIKVKCSSGTYIRSLAYDIGRELGCGAYLQELERTAIGDYKIEDAVDIEKLDENNWEKYLL